LVWISTLGVFRRGATAGCARFLNRPAMAFGELNEFLEVVIFEESPTCEYRDAAIEDR
jgi:hypothetical protein